MRQLSREGKSLRGGQILRYIITDYRRGSRSNNNIIEVYPKLLLWNLLILKLLMMVKDTRSCWLRIAIQS
jgi:hypothetical protein